MKGIAMFLKTGPISEPEKAPDGRHYKKIGSKWQQKTVAKCKNRVSKSFTTSDIADAPPPVFVLRTPGTQLCCQSIEERWYYSSSQWIHHVGKSCPQLIHHCCLSLPCFVFPLFFPPQEETQLSQANLVCQTVVCCLYWYIQLLRRLRAAHSPLHLVRPKGRNEISNKFISNDEPMRWVSNEKLWSPNHDFVNILYL